MITRLTVLLYDDDADVRELVPRVLRKHYDVITQSRLNDVVAEVKHLKPDLILMDYFMHNEDSSDAIRQLKANPSTKHIPLAERVIYKTKTKSVMVIKMLAYKSYIQRKPKT